MLTAWYVVRARPSGWPILNQSLDTRLTDGCCSCTRAGLRSGSAIKHVETTYLWLQQKKKNQELRIEKFRGTVNPADLMTKHLDGKRWVLLRDLLNIKHIGGRPTSAPKLTMDTAYTSRALRALAAMTLARQAAAGEIGVPSEAEHETWIDGYRADY